MRKKITFDVQLSRDPSKQASAKKEIAKRFGSQLVPVVEPSASDDSPGLNRYFEITLKSNLSDAWDIARDLVEIDGVSNAEPDISSNIENTLISILHQEEVESGQEKLHSKKKEEEEPTPPKDWFHEKTSFPDAIDYAVAQFTAGDGHFNKNQTGIRVGHLDTGYTNHPEIELMKKKLGHNFVAPPFWKRWFSSKWKCDPKDPVIKIPLLSWASHGTSSSSLLIGGDTDPQKIHPKEADVTNGVFPYVDMIPYRISTSVISFSKNLARAGAQAIKDGCKIITVSHASLIRSQLLEEVIADSYEKGIIWTAAAGTHFIKLKKIWIYPAKFPETIALAASTIEDEPWEWTHAGVAVDICAPGFRIYRPYAFRKWWNFGPVNYSYSYSDGSTFATPIVAGAAALWMAHHGNEKLDKLYKEGWQRVEAFRKVLKDSAKAHKSNFEDKGYGAGLLNTLELLKQPLPDAGSLKRAQPPTSPVEEETAEKKKTMITQKELVNLTCYAKVETEDSENDELFNYVEKAASPSAGKLLSMIAAEKSEVMARAVAKSKDPKLLKNPKSEALKTYIKELVS